MKLASAAAACLIAALAQPAFAQAVIKDFSFAELRATFDALRVTPDKDGQMADGARWISGEDENGLPVTVFGYECTTREPTQRCRGAYFSTDFVLEDPDTIPDALDAINYAAVKDEATAKGVKLSRYLILDEGVTRANFEANLRIFLSIGNKVWDMLDEEGYLD